MLAREGFGVAPERFDHESQDPPGEGANVVRADWPMTGPGTPYLKDGFLTLPLYHGTSSFFVPSILRHGLGGAVPFDPRALQQAIVRLLPIAREHGDQSLQACLFQFEWMGENAVTDGGASFRYGHTYLSASRWKAAMYSRNPYGSELVTSLIRLVDILCQVGTTLPPLPPSVVDTLDRLRAGPHEPVLVQADGVAASCLRNEDGGSIQQALRLLWDIANGRDDPTDEILQVANFECICSIPADRLRFYRVRVDRDDEWCPEFSFEPVEPADLPGSGHRPSPAP